MQHRLISGLSAQSELSKPLRCDGLIARWSGINATGFTWLRRPLHEAIRIKIAKKCPQVGKTHVSRRMRPTLGTSRPALPPRMHGTVVIALAHGGQTWTATTPAKKQDVAQPEETDAVTNVCQSLHLGLSMHTLFCTYRS